MAARKKTAKKATIDNRVLDTAKKLLEEKASSPEVLDDLKKRLSADAYVRRAKREAFKRAVNSQGRRVWRGERGEHPAIDAAQEKKIHTPPISVQVYRPDQASTRFADVITEMYFSADTDPGGVTRLNIQVVDALRTLAAQFSGTYDPNLLSVDIIVLARRR